MKTFLKVLGTTALLAALVPVKFQKDEETGEMSCQSLLWKLKVAPAKGDENTEIGLNLMEGVLTAPLMDAIAAKAEDEPHIFTDELTVDYDAPAGDAFPHDEVVVEAPQAPEAPAAPETPTDPEAPAAPQEEDTPDAPQA